MRLWELEQGDDGVAGQHWAGGIGEEDAVQAVPDAEDAGPRPARPPGNGEGAALHRFLQMVHDDREDEWDSDDMSEVELEG